MPVEALGVVGREAPPGPGVQSRPRLTHLDGLRALLLAGVMANHIVYVAPLWLGAIIPGAWFFLDIFFILSGFFIGTMLLNELGKTGGIRYRPFMIARLFRIYPALLLTILISTALMWRDGFAASELAKPVLANLTFVYNWPFGFEWGWPWDYSILYTLGIEVQFYLLLPLLMLALVKLKASRSVWVATVLGIIAASALTRALMWHGPQTFPGPYSYTHTRLDNLFVGVLAAMAVNWGWINRRVTIALSVLVVPAIAFFTWVLLTSSTIDPGLYRWKMAVAGWAGVVIVLWLITHDRHPVSQVLGWKPIAMIGEMSFAAYLWHYPIYMYAARHFAMPEQQQVAIVVVLTLGLSYLTFRFLEKPMYGLRRRFIHRPVTPMPTRELATTGAD